jgi:hypothetical protein
MKNDHQNKLRSVIVTAYDVQDHLCGLVVRVPVYRFRGTGSIPGATGFSEK